LETCFVCSFQDGISTKGAITVPLARLAGAAAQRLWPQLGEAMGSAPLVVLGSCSLTVLVVFSVITRELRRLRLLWGFGKCRSCTLISCSRAASTRLQGEIKRKGNNIFDILLCVHGRDARATFCSNTQKIRKQEHHIASYLRFVIVLVCNVYIFCFFFFVFC
jgi:hypothetical protein